MAEIVTKARDVMTKLQNPRTKFQVVNRLDTEEINRLRARYAYIKRKEFLFELLANYEGNMHNNNDHEEHRSDWSSSPSSDVNEDRPSATRPMTPSAEEADPIDMGDYENRIRPSQNYWYTVDGRNLAEKIIYYRTYGLQSTSELESTLREFRRPTVDPNAAEPQPAETAQVIYAAQLPGSKSARPQRTNPVFTAVRPASVPPDFVKSNNELLAKPKRPPTAHKKSPQKAASPLVFQNRAFDGVDDDPTASISDIHLTDESNDTKQSSSETKNQEASETKAQESAKSRAKVIENIRKKNSRDKMASVDENKMISKLDKRIEKDLKALQGIKDDDENDGDDDLDDAALDEILHGQMNSDIDAFLKAR